MNSDEELIPFDAQVPWELNPFNIQVPRRLKRFDLSGKISPNNTAFTRGRYADIWQGCLHHGNNRQTEVAMKRLKLPQNAEVAVPRFEKEIHAWVKLHHRNILELLGYIFDESGRLVLMTKWMVNGDAWNYVNQNPDHNPMRLVHGIARGLSYLHEKDILHLIKSDDVFVSDSGDAVISYSLENILTLAPNRALTLAKGETTGLSRYLAYEVFASETSYTKRVDVWAFGMTVYELLERRRPYAEQLLDEDVVVAISSRQLPSPASSSEPESPIRKFIKAFLWDICLRCWRDVPNDRPSIDSILTILDDKISEYGERILKDDDPVWKDLKRFDLSGRIHSVGRICGGGAFGDIRKAQLFDENGQNMKIAMKRLRVFKDKEVLDLFEKEIYVWSKLQHNHVLKLLGYVFESDGLPVLVSEWMDNGSAWEYINRNPDRNPIPLVRGIARGLSYLHENGILHSNLTSDNVLVSESGDALICDLGYSCTLATSRGLVNTTSTVKGKNRYLAYELLSYGTKGPDPVYTKETDVWLFGMTVFELLSRQRPYSEEPEYIATTAIRTKQLPTLATPSEPETFFQKVVKYILWDICQRCWIFQPNKRPGIASILMALEEKIAEQGREVLMDRNSVWKGLSWLDLSGRIVFTSKTVCTGAHADVQQGDLSYGIDWPIKVAITRPKYENRGLLYAFERELSVWSQLKHDNILELLGYVVEDGIPKLVSKWMDNGSAWTYINQNQDRNPMRLVHGTARGLSYLHEEGVLHLDIKPDNVLVSDSRDALIFNFACSRMLAADRDKRDGEDSAENEGTIRYQAPEALAPERPYTEALDVWAFGMTVYELLERRRVYDPLSDEEAIRAIQSKQLPSPTTPSGPEMPLQMAVKNILRNICQRCWIHEPKARPKMSSILASLEDKIAERGTLVLRDEHPAWKELRWLDLSGRINSVSNTCGGGAFGDIRFAWLSSGNDESKKVALKKLRIFTEKEVSELFEKEVYIWSKLKHDNILELIGYIFEDGLPVLVSEWMDKGSAWAYVNQNEQCNPMRLARGIARGLSYLHEKDVLHSDLKSDNVLVSDSGDALICDFGCSRTFAASRSLAAVTSSIKGTTRYMAYEFFASTNHDSNDTLLYTRKSDVWAFGMTVYELLARKRPYAHLSTDAQVILAIFQKELPSRPTLSQPGTPMQEAVRRILWDVCRRCWAHDRKKRATIEALRNELEKYGNAILQDFTHDNAEIPWQSDTPSAHSTLNPLNLFRSYMGNG